MKSKLTYTLSAMMWAMLLLAAYAVAAHAQIKSTNSQPAKKDNSAQPAGANSTVTGSGTAGQLTRWYGASGSSYVVGDSVITEDKFGKIGIGTTAPTSKLTVQGMIETTLGGYKFPDGTVQTTAAVSGLQSVFHNATLAGNGTSGSPLGIALPLQIKDTNSTIAVEVEANGTAIRGLTNSINTTGILGDNGGGGEAVVGRSAAVAGVAAVTGRNDGSGYGVKGFSTGSGGIGVVGQAGFACNSCGNTGDNTIAGRFENFRASNSANVLEVVNIANASGNAGYFQGNVQVVGNLSASGAKNFRIDHPLDPENKYLVHASIESSEVLNLYSGNVTLNPNGEATVQLPDWFEALNRDFRYALTAIGAPGPSLYVAEKLANHQFKIAGGQPGAEVSWQITGVRSDAYMKKHPMQVEVEKTEIERGHYLQPELYNQLEEKSIDSAHHPELMPQRVNEAKAAKGTAVQARPRVASDN
jgi:hypothetical protein